MWFAGTFALVVVWRIWIEYFRGGVGEGEGLDYADGFGVA